MQQRALGMTGIEVGELGFAFSWDPQGEFILQKGVEAGSGMFFIDGDDREARRWCERRTAPIVLGKVGTGSVTLAFLGPSGWRDLRAAEKESEVHRSEVFIARYHLMDQEVSMRVIPHMHRQKIGVVAYDILAGGALRGPVGHAPAGSSILRYAFLVREGRTMTQAAAQFVLANLYVSCAVSRVSSVEEVDEVLGALTAVPLTFQDLEGIFEAWAGRCDELRH